MEPGFPNQLLNKPELHLIPIHLLSQHLTRGPPPFLPSLIDKKIFNPAFSLLEIERITFSFLFLLSVNTFLELMLKRHV